MRHFNTVVYWRKQHGYCKALILENPYGKRLVLKREDPTPVGRWALIGVID